MHENNVQEYLATMSRLEPKVDPSVPQEVALASIAISLRRIADSTAALEQYWLDPRNKIEVVVR